jgi:hypothetical protein
MIALQPKMLRVLHGAGVAGLALVLLFLTHHAQGAITDPTSSSPTPSPARNLLDPTLGSCEGYTAQPGVRSIHPCGDAYDSHGSRIFDKLGRPIAERPNLPAPGDELLFHTMSLKTAHPAARHWSFYAFSPRLPTSDLTHLAITFASLPQFTPLQNDSPSLFHPLPRMTSWLSSVAHAAGFSADYSISSDSGLIRAGDGSAYQPTYSTWATTGFGSGHTRIYGGLVAETMMIVHRTSLNMNWGTSYGFGGGLQFLFSSHK